MYICMCKRVGGNVFLPYIEFHFLCAKLVGFFVYFSSFCFFFVCGWFSLCNAVFFFFFSHSFHSLLVFLILQFSFPRSLLFFSPVFYLALSFLIFARMSVHAISVFRWLSAFQIFLICCYIWFCFTLDRARSFASV